MERRDSLELAAVFTVGAIVGVGAALLLRPHPAMPQRLVRHLRHTGRQLGHGARRAAREAGSVRGSLASAGREAMDQFRDEVAQIVASAREQLAEDVNAHLHGRHGRRCRGR